MKEKIVRNIWAIAFKQVYTNVEKPIDTLCGQPPYERVRNKVLISYHNNGGIPWTGQFFYFKTL